MESQEALSQYQSTGHNEIEGWMGAGLFPVLRVCQMVQEAVDEKGGAVEIGIHHGQFFIALNQLCKPDEPSLAIDVFDAQNLNVDGSGCGSLKKFKENLGRYCVHKGSNVRIVAADSTALGASDVLNELSMMRPRLFSVDGGHTVRHVVSDLSLAAECVSRFGVIFVDDFLNPHWLGVAEGVCRYLSHAPHVLPFAINSNKLLLCRAPSYEYYSRAFAEFLSPPHRAEFFGREVLFW